MFTLHQLAKANRRQQDKGTPPIYSAEDLETFPVLQKRNVWCIQRHWATAPHYDLRLKQREGLPSWAIPKGLVGMRPDETRLAVETTVHPLSYATFEGADPGMTGLLWDVGFYTVEEAREDPDSQGGESDPDGAFEEEKLDLALTKIHAGKKHSFTITLRGGHKLNGASFILTYQRGHDQYQSTGKPKKQWFVRLPRDTNGLDWGPGGEDGPVYGRSVKSGRSMAEVCGS